MRLTVATCQFPVDSDIRRNLRYVSRQIRTAKDRGAHVAHFPEASLSGYAGVDFPSHEGFDWTLLRESTQRVLDLARQFHIWVILGSTHRLTGKHKPHNSLYIIDDRGELVDRYDKMFCAGDRSGTIGDLAHESCWPSFFVRPDGVVTGSLRLNIAGVLVSEVNTDEQLYDSTVEWRDRAMDGIFHSGTLVRDRRSDDRTRL